MLKIARIMAATLALLASGGVVGAPAEESNGQLLKGKAAFGGWQQDKPGVKRLITLPGLAADRQFDLQLGGGGSGARRRQAAGPGGVFSQYGDARPCRPARHPGGAEWRPVRCRQRVEYVARPSCSGRQCQAGPGRGLNRKAEHDLFPLVTCLLLSLLFSLVYWVVSR